MVILPRRELAQSEIQQITINGLVTGGSFQIGFNGIDSASIAWNSGERETIRSFLEAISTIGPGNVEVLGGPLPSNPIQIYFKGELANRDVPPLYATNALIGEGVGIVVETLRGGIEALDELGVIPPRDQRYLIEALEHLRPQTTITSYKPASGTQSRIIWNQINGTSDYVEVVRYVTGTVGVPWPAVSGRYWIEQGIEHEGKRVRGDLQHHYIGFHNIARAVAYTESALTDPDYQDLNRLVDGLTPNEHVGQYTTYQRSLYPVLGGEDTQYQNIADYAMADYAEPLTVTTQQDESVGAGNIINGIYPVEYQDLPGVPPVKYKHEQFWGSIERASGDDYLELDLGGIEAVNYISFEATRKPYSISLDYDVLDQGTEREFTPVLPHDTLPSNWTIGYSPSFTNPWEQIVINFTDARRELVFTRFLRIKFARRPDTNSPFIGINGDVRPSSIEVRNLRIGRYAA